MSDENRQRPIAAVTGASSGIGRAYARRLAGEGYDLLLIARRLERLDLVAKEVGAASDSQVEVLAADLAEPEQRREVEERLASEPRLAMLVNSAGFGTAGVGEGRFRGNVWARIYGDQTLLSLGAGAG